jgi:hypothetical protein
MDATIPIRDSGVVDSGAPPDTATPDAGPQPLTVTVLLAGAPEPGVTIVFQDDTGAFLSSATTDSAGSVTQIVIAGSQVTALLGTPSAPSPLTIQGVAPGDVLTVLDTTSITYEPDEEVAVTLPTPTWDASGASEQIYAGPCSTSPTNPLYLQQDCQAQGQFPILARAQDSIGNEIAYTYEKGNDLAPDGGIPDGDDGVLPISISRPWSTSTATQTITALNVPPIPDAGPGGVYENVTLSYNEYTGGVTLSAPGGVSTVDDAGDQTETFAIHPGYPDVVQVEAYVDLDYDYGNTEAIVAGATRTAPVATSQPPVSFDLSTLPLFTASSIATPDGGTTSQPTVTWTTAGSISGAAGVFVQVQWSSSPPDGGNYIQGTWTILAPSTATSVSAPALPPELAAWAPSPGPDTFLSQPRVGAVQASFLPTYATLRAQFGGLPFFPGNNYELVVPELPVNGTLYVSGIYPDEG